MKRITILIIVFLFIITGCNNNFLSAKEIADVKGKEININGILLKIKAKDFRNEVKPLYPLGYYPHYKEKEGYYYHLIHGTLKNTTNKKINIKNIKVISESKSKTNQGKLVLINEIQSYFWEEIEPNENLDFYFFSLVKKGEEPFIYKFYFDNDWKIKKDQVKFDKVLNYHVPKDIKVNKNV